MRTLRVAGAQLGAIQKADSRQAVVARMIALLDQAKARGADLVVFPELALTTFFPRWYHADRADADHWFERQMPGPATQPLFDHARRSGLAMTFGYAELTPEGRHFNTSILVDKAGAIVGTYRKVHLPGHVDYDPERTHQHLEKRYFEPGDLGFPAFPMLGGILGMMICNDRRWPEAWRVLGLQGVELVTLGFNTPSVNSQKPGEGPVERAFHHKLSVQAGAYQNSTWAVAVAKAGVEDGYPMFGCSLIVDPDGRIVAETTTEDDELIVADCDLDATRFGKETIFDFARHRRPEHYRSIVDQIGVERPSGAPARPCYTQEIAAARATLDAFMAAFNTGDAKAVAATYHFPHVRLHSGKVTVFPTAADFDLSNFRATSDAREWARSIWDHTRVIHAGPDKVQFDTRFSRLRADGSTIATYDSIYIVTRIGGRWGIQARSSFAA
jgi:predicted amidohydrolase